MRSSIITFRIQNHNEGTVPKILNFNQLSIIFFRCKMSFQSNLAPGVFKNLITHAVAMALVPLGVFFAVKWAGFSGTAAAISKFKDYVMTFLQKRR